jgi:pyruvate/2-oxoglutarate dehydrogenase complex dihydrolipoamide acyltransferase (E2) component
MNLSARQLAAELGCSHSAVNKAYATGRIVREPDGGFDLEKCRAVWNENVVAHQQRKRAVATESPPAPEPSAGPRPESEFTTAQIERQIALERLAEKRRQNDQAAGRLIDKAATVGVLGQIGAIYARGRDGIPAQLAAKLIGRTDIDEIERIIRKALRDVDNRIADQISSHFANTHESSAAA